MTGIGLYGTLSQDLVFTANYFKGGASINELKKHVHNAESGLMKASYDIHDYASEKDLLNSIEILKKALSIDSDNNQKLETLMNEWNENVASVFGVRFDTFDEFAKAVADVSTEWLEFKKAQSQQQQTQQQSQPQQTQLFTDVNALICENNYLREISKQKDDEIAALKARLDSQK